MDVRSVSRMKWAFLAIASAVAIGCMQEQSVSNPEVAANSSPHALRGDYVDQLIEMGAPENGISLYVDPETKDTSFIVSTPLDRAAINAGHKSVGLAFRKKTLDALRAKKSKIPPHATEKGNAVGKSAQTRWVAGQFDVKALTEVHQIKVYFEISGGTKMKPKWAAAAREAMAIWNNVPGTEVSFVETYSSVGSDVRLGCMITWGEEVVSWLTPDPWIEKDSVQIFYNYGVEDIMPHDHKVLFAMIGFGNILNITHTDQQGSSWLGGGVQLNIAGTPNSDPSSIFQFEVTPKTPVFSANDIRTIQQLYPAGAILSKKSNNDLVSSGWEATLVHASNVNTFQQEGDTVTYLKNDGSLWRKIGLTAGGSTTQLWPSSSGFLTSFIASNGYLAVQRSTGQVYTRKPNTTTWTLQSQGSPGTPQYRLAGERLVLYYPSTGSLYSRWLVSNPYSWSYDWYSTSLLDFQVRGQRLAVADNGYLFAMDGYSGWVQLWSGYDGIAKKIYLSDSHTGMIVNRGMGFDEAAVKEGLYGIWDYYGAPNSPEHVDLCGDKLAVINFGQSLYIKDYGTGASNAHWSFPGQGGTSAVRLTGPMCDHVTRLDHNGSIWAKYSLGDNPGYFPYHNSVVSLPQRP
jgi:hypothetical protein